MKSILSAAAIALATALSAPALAGQGTREEAVALVQKVQAQLKAEGVDKTIATINSKTYNDRDLYPFAIRFDGVMVADGLVAALIGKNLMAVKDPEGKSPGEEMLNVAKSGKPGWVDYSWPNPATKKIEAKSVYVEPAAGADMLIAVSVYR